MIEIERKFLIETSKTSPLDMPGHSLILKQGYLVNTEDITVRVRTARSETDSIGYITIKRASTDGGLSRYEFETEILAEDAEELLGTCTSIIEKTRRVVPYKGHLFEVDYFHGDNDGLIIAEVELNSVDEYVEFPEWISTEVTGDTRYYNAHLAKFPYRSW